MCHRPSILRSTRVPTLSRSSWLSASCITSPWIQNRVCRIATSGVTNVTLTSGERRALARYGPFGPCRRCIRSRKPWRLVVQAPLTVMNCASSASDAARASGSCRFQAMLNWFSISRIASSSAWLIVVSLPAGCSPSAGMVRRRRDSPRPCTDFRVPGDRLLRRLDVAGADHLRPFLFFGAKLLRERLGRAADRVEPQRCQPLLQVRRADDPDDLPIELVNDFLRRTSWNKRSDPAIPFEARVARGHNSGDLRQGTRRLPAHDGEQAQLAIARELPGGGETDESDRRMAGDDRGGRRPAPGKGDVHEVETKRHAQLLAQQVRRRAKSRRGVAVFAR